MCLTLFAKHYYALAYFCTTQNVDGYIGEIMMAFKDAGIYDETLFILTADHGGLVVWY